MQLEGRFWFTFAGSGSGAPAAVATMEAPASRGGVKQEMKEAAQTAPER